MGKVETVQLYLDNYLAGKAPDFCERFKDKSIDKQYAAIMAWRRKQRIAEDTPQTCNEIVDHIQRTCTLVSNMSGIKESDVARLENEVYALADYLSGFKAELRRREIEDLERRRAEIEAKLNELRSR